MEAGHYYTLPVDRITDPGVYLHSDDGDVLLPHRFVPQGTQVGDEIKVFVYHDSESRLIATTQRPAGEVGEIVYINIVGNNKQGAFADWGLMKDLFIPVSQQRDKLFEDQYYFIKIYRDEQTGRIAGTQKFEHTLSNETLSVRLHETIKMLIYRETEIGYEVIINSKHIGLLHFEDAFLPVKIGRYYTGAITRIRDENKIDVRIGERGYQKVSGEAERILRKLQTHNGYLPLHDKSDPEEIYRILEMSKKTFKMSVGQLLKEGKIILTQSGIKLKDA